MYAGTPKRCRRADEWATRTVYACDQRKVVIVEGVRADEKLSPAKAQQVADLLQDLMRYCNAEVKARIAKNELITLSINGLPYQQYVPGMEPPIELVRGSRTTAIATARSGRRRSTSS